MRSPAATAALVLFLCFACNMFGRGIGDSYLVFLLPLSSDFAWTRAEASSVYSTYLVVGGLSAPLTGMLIDRLGARVVYPLGLLLLGVACLTARHLTQLWQFQACIGLIGGMGVSMLGMVPASMLISRWFRDRMSTAMGVAYAGFGTGTLVIVPLAQYSIELQGWRDTYGVMGLVALALIPLLFLLPWRAITEDSPRGNRKGVPVPDTTRAWAVKEALRTRPYWQLVQVFSFTSIAMVAVLAQVVPFLVEVALTPLEAATAFGIAGLLSVFGMMASGWSADRIGYRAAATTSFTSTFIGIACLLLLSYHPARWLVVPFVLFFGIAQGARGPLVASLAAKHFGGGGFATIYGTMFMCMSIGGAFGSWLSGLLYDVTGGYRAGFVFSLVCVLIAAAPFWTSKPLRPEARQ